MALPKINDLPKYELTIPSTKTKINFRPFLGKEQKVLLIAMESQDQTQILNAINDTIEACVLTPIDVKSLTSFDVEYLFVKIRAKSVGEKSNISAPCTECEKSTHIQINLDDIEVNIPSTNKTIRLNDEYVIKLRYPRYRSILENEQLQKAETITDMMYHIILSCLDSLQSETVNIKFDDESEQEITSFMDSLTSSQFNELMVFVQNIPKLTHKLEFDCSHCKHHNTLVLEGIQDFF